MSILQDTKTNHAMNLMRSLDALRRRRRNCDFIIRVEDKSFTAHRVVLSACSDYFAAMLSCDMKESRGGIVDIKAQDSNAVKSCIDFMYTGEITITTENVQSILNASHMIQLSSVTKLCLKFLGNELTVENCLTVKNLAEIYGGDGLIERAMSFAVENITKIIKFDLGGYLNMKYRDVRTILKSSSSEIDLNTRLEAIKSWVRHDKEIRLTYLSELMESSGIYNGSFEFLFREVLNDNLVKQSPFCRKAVIFELFRDNDSLSENINSENCFQLYDAAQSSESFINTRAKAEIEKYLKKVQIPMLCNSSALVYKNLSKSNVCLLFSIAGSTTLLEQYKWRFAVEWTKHGRGRKKLFPKLIQTLYYGKFTKRFFQDTVLTEPLLLHCRNWKNLLQAFFNDCFASNPAAILILDRAKAIIDAFNTSSGKLTFHSLIEKSKVSFIADLDDVVYLFCNSKLFQYTSTEEWKCVAAYPGDSSKVVELVAHMEGIYFMSHEEFDISRFNCVDRAMSKITFQPKCTYGTSYISAGEFIYSVGGSRHPRGTFRFNPSKGSCEKLFPTIYNRYNAGGAALKGKIYVLDGCFATQAVEVYEPDTNIWSEVARLQHHRQLFSAVVADGKLYAVGGVYDRLRSHEDFIEEYNYEENSWEVVKTMRKIHGQFRACSYRKVMQEPVNRLQIDEENYD